MKSLIHVEDNLSWQENFQDLATDLNLDLRQFASREAALKAISEKLPDIVVTDLHLRDGMPRDRSGYAIARAAKDAGVKHVVIASETADPSEVVDGVNLITKNEAANWLTRLIRGERG